MTANEGGQEEAQIWKAAHLATGGPAEYVLRFLAEIKAERYTEAREYLDPQFEWGDLRDLDLDVLVLPGWVLSGMPRKSVEGYEIVLFVFMEGVTEETIIDTPTALPGCEFLVRETDAGDWTIFQIKKPAR